MFRLNMFVWIVAVVSVLAMSGTVDGRAFPNAFPRPTRQTTESIILDEQVPPTPKVLFYDQLVTHFDSSDARTFKNKYLIYDGFWDGEETSPMFFYCGNEGVIMDFYNNTGLMFDIGPQFNARIVFVEHRYYGDSMPFGADSLSSKETLQYLTVEEVLEDFTAIIKELKTDYPNQPVISFGGSYGGMLSAWYRLKYPQVIDGAISASAPVLQYEGYTNPENFSRVCTQDFAGADPACPGEILDGFAQILEDGATADGRAQLSSDFMLCNALRNTADVDQLVAFVTAAFQYTAMVDYPYRNSFLQPVPAFPVNAMCNKMQVNSDGSTNLPSMARAVGVYYNHTGNQQCFNITQSAAGDLGMRAWDYQACTQLILPSAQDGIHDMFLPVQTWDFDDYAQWCKEEFDVTANATWIPDYTGAPLFEGGSRIVFSNGDLDPWMAGGVLASLGTNDSMPALMIEGGAHHLDLRFANAKDPQSVIDARNFEVKMIKQWLKESALETL